MVLEAPYPAPNHIFGSYFVVYNDDENSHLYKTFSLYTWTFDQQQISSGQDCPFLDTKPTYYEFGPSDHYAQEAQTYYYPQTEHEFVLLPWKFRMGSSLPSGEIVHDYPILVFKNPSLLPADSYVLRDLQCNSPDNHDDLACAIEHTRPPHFAQVPKCILIFLASLYAIVFYMFLFK